MSDTWSPGAHVSEWEEGPLDELFRLLEPPAWHARAKCKGMGNRMFYPARGEIGGEVNAKPQEEYPARRICAACPVRRECMDAGLREIYGIWGGLSGRERQRLRRARRMAV